VPATAFIPSNGVGTGPTPPLVGVPSGGRGPSTGSQQAANSGARVHTLWVPAKNAEARRPSCYRALWSPYVGAGSNINTERGPAQAGRPVKSRNNRNLAPLGPPPAARNPANQTPRAVQPHRRSSSLVTANGRHHTVREVDAMAGSGQNRRFKQPTAPKRSARVTADHHARTGSPTLTPFLGQNRPAHTHGRPDRLASAAGKEDGHVH